MLVFGTLKRAFSKLCVYWVPITHRGLRSVFVHKTKEK